MSSPLPPHTESGLLASIAENALDDDYYEVRVDDAQSGGGSRTMVTAVGLALFALLMTVALVQSRLDRPADQVERDTLISSIRTRQASLAKRTDQANALRLEVERLHTISNQTNPEFERLRALTADRAATGPGIVIEADNSRQDRAGGRVSDTDLQLLVNGLWYAGAEAIAINDSRLSTLSAIHTSGQAITVNFSSITAPYRIVALGDPESLTDRLSENPGGRYWDQRVRKSGLRFEVHEEKSVSVPAAPAKRVSLSKAHVIEGDK